MYRKLVARIFGITLLLSTFAVWSQEPIAMLETVTTNVRNVMQANKKIIADNPKEIYKIANEHILPYIDFIEMSRWVAGRNAWRKSSEAQRKEFIAEFKILVVNTYTNALQAFGDRKIKFLPSRKKKTDRKRIMVFSQVTDEFNETLQVDYRLIKHNSNWKVYDIIIQGVSLLKGYQTQFSDTIRTSGLTAATNSMREHNSKQ